jgi:hypothetical protein
MRRRRWARRWMHIDGFVRGKGKLMVTEYVAMVTEYVATDPRTGPR